MYYEDIIEAAGQNPDVVFIDFFDTIVERTVNPEDVKKISSRKLSELLGGRFSHSEIYSIRSSLEKDICNSNFSSGYDLEFNFFTLRDQLAEKLSTRSGIPSTSIAQWIVNIELSTECAVQLTDPTVVKLLEGLRNNSIPVYLISDFYLPKPLFFELLDHHSLTHFFKEIFVSADDLLTKRSGRRYVDIRKKLLHDDTKAVMIGDNYEADYSKALEHGLAAIHIDRSEKHKFYRSKKLDFGNWNLLEKQIKCVIKQDNVSKVFPELALTLSYSISKLFHELTITGHQEVFFLSREGQFLKSLFDDYQDITGHHGSRRIQSHYFCVSRRSTFLPSLKLLKHEDFETLFRQYRRISIIEFLENLGLSHLSEPLGEDLGVDVSARFEDLSSSDIFPKLISNQRFINAYEKRRKEQFDAFSTYLCSFQNDNPSSKIAVVDVGWKGTIQDNIYNFLTNGGSKKTGFKSIDGYYIGLVAPGNKNEMNRKWPLIFSCLNGRSKGFEFFNENRSLFEITLAANHGSVRGYSMTSKNSASPLFEDFTIECQLFEDKISPLQENLRDAIQRITKHLNENTYSKSKLHSFVTRQHARMVLKPSQREIQWLLSSFHVENFGVFETSRFSLNGNQLSISDRVKFTYRLLTKKPPQDLGFWPWLTIKQKALPFLHIAYASRRWLGLPR